MIVFDGLWQVMAEKGITTYTLLEKCGFDSKTVRRLQRNNTTDRRRKTSLFMIIDKKVFTFLSNCGMVVPIPPPGGPVEE